MVYGRGWDGLVAVEEQICADDGDGQMGDRLAARARGHNVVDGCKVDSSCAVGEGSTAHRRQEEDSRFVEDRAMWFEN